LREVRGRRQQALHCAASATAVLRRVIRNGQNRAFVWYDAQEELGCQAAPKTTIFGVGGRCKFAAFHIAGARPDGRPSKTYSQTEAIDFKLNSFYRKRSAQSDRQTCVTVSLPNRPVIPIKPFAGRGMPDRRRHGLALPETEQGRYLHGAVGCAMAHR